MDTQAVPLETILRRRQVPEFSARILAWHRSLPARRQEKDVHEHRQA